MKVLNPMNTSVKLLLHSCCAPCSSSVIEKLENDYDITILYYNPNIEPEEEYLKRKEEQMKFLRLKGINYLDIDYQNEVYKKLVKGYEQEPENALRCKICYELRLQKTAEIGCEHSFDYFATTLSVSPHKNSDLINELGVNIEKRYNIRYLVSDFKKQDGYLRSIELAREYELYRQSYCGCLYSKGE